MNDNDTQNLHQQLDDYEKLLNVLQSLGSSLEVETILRQIIEAALSLCNAQQGAIMLFDPASQEIAKTLIRQNQARENCSITTSTRYCRGGRSTKKRRN